ncbi:MAG: tryptophan synthase subunit alpha [unclassified Hahellaceae]|nr:tryptophan synthase subunit alpha [Hahellaceae bacterium]|tara:strand:+ start:70408 stop:71229 length:822 start_codon:yes stop_codon:yes gene_type:complete
MSRLKAHFEALEAKGLKALIPYITAGDPNLDATLKLMHALVESGADAIEIGIPFSDPMADGPVIQKACERALASGTSLKKILAMISEFRKDDTSTPLVLMGYLNPLEAMGFQVFTDAAAKAGVDGVLTVDLPPEEAGRLAPMLQAADLDPIFLIAPTTQTARIRTAANNGGGYIYYVSLNGVTGSSKLDVESVRTHVEAIRKESALPVCVGFGIKDAVSARQVAAVSDGVIVGSALVNIIAEHAEQPEQMIEQVKGLMTSIRQALDDLSAQNR